MNKLQKSFLQLVLFLIITRFSKKENLKITDDLKEICNPISKVAERQKKVEEF